MKKPMRISIEQAATVLELQSQGHKFHKIAALYNLTANQFFCDMRKAKTNGFAAWGK